MNIVKAAEEAGKLLEAYAPTRDYHGKTLEHCQWMLQGIVLGYIEGEKAHRWLGYAQALIVMHEVADLHKMKVINALS